MTFKMEPTASQVHNELQGLKADVKDLASVQSDMRDAILILTENFKNLEAVNKKLYEHDKDIQDLRIRTSILESAVNNYNESLKGIHETKLVNRALVFLAGLIATGIISLTFKVVYQWINS